MSSQTNIFNDIRQNMDEVIHGESTLGHMLWAELLKMHPADIAYFFEDIDAYDFKELFIKLPTDIKFEVFEQLTDPTKVTSLMFMSEHEKAEALNVLSPDELTDLFDLFSDEELKVNLNLLHKKARHQVLTLLKFDPESAGGIMDTEALTFLEEFTVEKCIALLRRLAPHTKIYQQIYVTDRGHRLVGHISLEDLVLHQPHARISSFMHKNELIAQADQDRESIAKQMVHYGLMTVPVVSSDNQFLGIIPSETLVDVLVEEGSEDIQRMSALAPMKQTYFETSFIRLLSERGGILITLLIAQSFTTFIMKSNEATLYFGSLIYFTQMLVSTGGNSSSQTSALVIQGLATGEIRPSNIFRFLRRELLMALGLAAILGFVAFVRAYITTYELYESAIISISLAFIVLISVSLGSGMPLLLRRLNLDPAFSAGPFLATVMDILGVLIYCYVAKLFLGTMNFMS